MMAAKSTVAILRQLRKLMKSKKYTNEILHAYIIPSGDAHQSEYIASRHKRREYISKFTGSTGTAIVTENEALLWTDGRYFLQAEKELDQNWTLMKDGLQGTPKKEEWLSQNLPSGAVVGVDANLISLDEWGRIYEALKKSGHSLIRVDPNLVDKVWADDGIPAEPNSDLLAVSDEFSGRNWKEKVCDLQSELRSSGVFAVVIAALDEVAWLFNLRGADISYNPVFMAYAIVTVDDVSLFIDESRVSPKNIRNHLHLDEEKSVKIYPYNGWQEELRALGKMEKKIWISSRSSCALASFIPMDYLKRDISPVSIAKVVKNDTEIKGMKNAHIRDGAALCEYIYWLEHQVPHGNIDEVGGANKLECLRRENDNFVSLSFPTISATGPNGAIIHYRPEADTCRVIKKEDMYVVDSGAQYLDGTTDVTRTVHFGTPTTHQKDCFTRVLKGHIALARCVFPKGTRGHKLDILARTSLWENGIDYQHGTGHGVGAFLNVHEGPIGISMINSNDHPLDEGMFLSDEPGYYEDGNFGIRIESILLTKEVQFKHNLTKKKFLGFEPVTLVPIEKKLLIPELLTVEEINWLNDYHATVLEKVGGFLMKRGKTDVFNWLNKQTSLLG